MSGGSIHLENSKYKIYYDKYFYDFDGTNWIKKIPEPDTLITGYSPPVIIMPAMVYCPYIPIFKDDNGSK